MLGPKMTCLELLWKIGENTPKNAKYLHQQCFGHILKKEENEDQKTCYLLGGTEEQLQKSYWNTWGDKEDKLFQKTC